MLLAGLSGGAHEAQAGLRFCNQGNIKLSTAVGYVDRQKGWVAKGWIHIDPGECKDALRFKLDNRFYYYYANGRDENSRIKITGENSFCIELRKFTIYQSDYGKSTPEECVKDGLRSVKFKKVDVQGKPEFTVNMGGPENAPSAGADPTPAPPDQPPVATEPPPAVRQPPVIVQQPSGPAARPPAAAEENPPIRRGDGRGRSSPRRICPPFGSRLRRLKKKRIRRGGGLGKSSPLFRTLNRQAHRLKKILRQGGGRGRSSPHPIRRRLHLPPRAADRMERPASAFPIFADRRCRC